MVIGTLNLNCDWNGKDVTAKKFNQFCEFHIFIIGETTIVLLDLFADPHSNRIEIKFLSEGLQRVTHRWSSNLIDVIEKWN
jgi:hypothetical protein